MVIRMRPNKRKDSMKPLIAILAALVILAPSVAQAGKYSSRSKVTNFFR